MIINRYDYAVIIIIEFVIMGTIVKLLCSTIIILLENYSLIKIIL